MIISHSLCKSIDIILLHIANQTVSNMHVDMYSHIFRLKKADVKSKTLCA